MNTNRINCKNVFLLFFFVNFSMGKQVNGLSVNLLWNLYKKINGISLGMVNQTARTHGLQIGLFNKGAKLRGFQLGLCNANEKRSMPFINWSF
ncbi:MAG: hypothetical protein K9G58_07985 [Bacteroidales bacterium]|nr:hypothetical protein [Bacteroidales bacterium]MCF8398090.1 hypothetical protein [Bacteroidales bacterium]